MYSRLKRAWALQQGQQLQLVSFSRVWIRGGICSLIIIELLVEHVELSLPASKAARKRSKHFPISGFQDFVLQEKMLDIIQMAFGDLGKFNESVRGILHAIDWMRTCPREWLSPSSMGSPVPSKSPLSALSSPIPKGSKGFPEVPDDSPIPSIPSPRKRHVARTAPRPDSPASPASPMVGSSPRLPEDSPIPSMPSPKEYQWLN